MDIVAILANKKIYSTTVFFIFVILLVSMAFSVRLANSISVILLAAIVILSVHRLSFLRNAFTNIYFLSCLCFLFINILGLLYTTDPAQNIREASIKTGIAAIPFFFCANLYTIKVDMNRLMLLFTLSLVVTTLYCVLHAFFVYLQHYDSSVFFYHTLLSPFNEHAIYYSFYLLFCIIYWVEEGIAKLNSIQKKISIISILVYFVFIIILLSSKIVLSILFLYFIYFSFYLIITKKSRKFLVATIAFIAIVFTLLLTTKNPIKNRFADMAVGTHTLFLQKKYNPGVYFNGLQFRLLTGRFTLEILSEQKAWLLGVSAGDGQKYLRKKYIEADMYQGDGVHNEGYLMYNCHNIYLQTSLESGMIGLFSLFFVIITLLFKIIKRKKRAALIFFLCMLVFGFTESYLSRQFGIVLFTFMPLLALSVSDHKSE